MRELLITLVIIALLAAAAGVLHQYEQTPREDPLGKKLLYTPGATYLELISLGNKGLVADYMFLWSIQYYAQFKPNSQFMYLDRIYDLITDLDPHYMDPYRVGAIIMLIEAEGDPVKRRQAVFKILDKGIRNIPDDHRLAQEAAWICYIKFDDLETAARYARIAAERPTADHWTKRMYGQFSVKSHQFSLDDAIRYWEEMYMSAKSDYQRMASRNMLFDLYSRKAKEILNPLLQAYRDKFGHCPSSWKDVIEANIVPEGVLKQVLIDFAGNQYEIDQERCAVVAVKKLEEGE